MPGPSCKLNKVDRYKAVESARPPNEMQLMCPFPECYFKGGPEAYRKHLHFKHPDAPKQRVPRTFIPPWAKPATRREP